MKNSTLLLLLLVTSYMTSQQQIGEDIPGLEQGDQFGGNVDISGDGNRVLCAAPFGENLNDNFAAGYITTYELSNGSWVQLGQTIEGDAAVDQLGLSAAISNDGTTIAAGAPFNDDNGTSSGRVRVYRLLNETWTQIGQDLVGFSQNQLGVSLDISANGNIIAMGTVNSVNVFQLENDIWELVGDEIFQSQPNTSFGRTVALSNEGTRIAIGGPFNDEDFTNAGQVQVYDLVDDNWLQIGQNINGNAPGAAIGNDDSIAFSGDGNILAIGFTRANTANGNATGEVRLYRFSEVNNSWGVVDTVIGDNGGNLFGFSVALNGDGRDLIVTAPTTIGSNGFTRFFRDEGSGYNALINSVDPQSTGRTVALSMDGVAAVGYPFGTANGVSSGFVRVFDLEEEILSIENQQQEIGFKLFPNPSNNVLSLQINSDFSVTNINIYNMLGQLVLSQDITSETIDISSLESGSYLLAVTTNQGRLTETFIKNN